MPAAMKQDVWLQKGCQHCMCNCRLSVEFKLLITEEIVDSVVSIVRACFTTEYVFDDGKFPTLE